MSIAAYGVQGTVDDSHWAQMLLQLGDGRAGMSVRSGLVVSAATGTRLLNVSPGQCLQAGVYVIAAAGSTYTVTVTANTGTNSRYDLICMQVDWLAAEAAYTAAGGDASPDAAGAAAKLAGASLVAVQGAAAASPALPTLTQNAGTLWQTPLARVLVRPGVTQIASADVLFYQPADVEKTISGEVVLSAGGTDPSSKAVSFPPSYFASTPRVVITANADVPANVTQNLSATGRSASGFTANISRSTTTSVTCSWIASGL